MPLSSSDCIGPAFKQAKNQLFSPFRFGRWWRLALLAAITGELAGSWSGCNFNLPSGGGGGSGKGEFVRLLEPPGVRPLDPTWDAMKTILPMILVGVVIALVLLVAWAFAGSVCRFILFESVLRNRAELRAGWSRWRPKGVQYFLWTMAFNSASLLAFVIIVGVPALLAWQAGFFENAQQHVAVLVGGGLIVFLVLVVLAILGTVVDLFARDFLLAVLAMEDVNVMDGWRRVLAFVRAEKMEFFGYIVMKAILAVGSSVFFGIINLIIVLIIAVIAVAVGFGAAGAGATWNAATIAAAVVAGVVTILAVFLFMCLIYAPGLVFFQSFTQHFFGSRYPALGVVLFPPPPTPPVAAQTDATSPPESAVPPLANPS